MARRRGGFNPAQPRDRRGRWRSWARGQSGGNPNKSYTPATVSRTRVVDRIAMGNGNTFVLTDTPVTRASGQGFRNRYRAARENQDLPRRINESHAAFTREHNARIDREQRRLERDAATARRTNLGA